MDLAESFSKWTIKRRLKNKVPQVLADLSPEGKDN